MLEPRASKPSPDWMQGRRLLSWSWAVERLEAERNYWLVTVRHDGFPQARPVWGVWDDEVGLLLSVGHGGLQRAEKRSPLPITVHTDDAIDVVILEGVVDRIVPYAGGDADVTLEVAPEIRRAALERYNAKYDWDFDVDGDGLNFLVRPSVAYGWSSTPKAVEGGTRWTFAPS